MSHPELEMSAYAQLAVLSHDKRQPMARDRFLLLCGAAACRAGWPEVAEQCRLLHNAHQPHHRLVSSASFSDALRDAEFEQIITRWSRWCSFERAEHLLQRLGQQLTPSQPETSLGDWVLQRLGTLTKASTHPPVSDA